MEIQLSDWVENIVGKGEIARYERFLLFLQCFQKLSVVDEHLWSKGFMDPDPDDQFSKSYHLGYFHCTKGNHSHYFGFA